MWKRILRSVTNMAVELVFGLLVHKNSYSQKCTLKEKDAEIAQITSPQPLKPLGSDPIKE